MRKSSVDQIYKALLVLWTAESYNKIFTYSDKFKNTAIDVNVSKLNSHDLGNLNYGNNE